MKYDWVKKITYMDGIIVLGLGMMTAGLGIKIKGVREKANTEVEVRKTEQVLELRVNINQAGRTELESLPAIGEKTAQKIIDYRNKHGPFRSKEEIKNVSGIGEKTYEKVVDKIEI